MIKGKGYIKEYDYNDDLKYEGEFMNGFRNWKIKEFYNNDVRI